MMITGLRRYVAWGVAALAGWLAAVPLKADDTEIYFSGQEAGRPNVLFVLDGSGSMRDTPEGQKLAEGAKDPNSRYQIMRRALNAVLGSIPDNINAGLLHYGGHKQPAVSNGVKYPVSALSDEVRAGIAQEVENLQVDGYTPIVQSLYESALYFRGGAVDYGSATDPTVRAASERSLLGTVKGSLETVERWCSKSAGECDGKKLERCEYPCLQPTYTCNGGLDEAGFCRNPVWECSRYGTVADSCMYLQEVPSTRISGNYRSPIDSVCQANFIVLLSDGEPDDGLWDSDSAIVNKVTGMVGNGCANQPAGLEDGRCGPELTRFLATQDQSPALEGKQVVHTYAIGFAVEGRGQDYLKSVANLGEEAAKAGKSGFFAADNESELVQALTEIIDTISESAFTLSPPALSIDSTTRLENSSEVFLPMFRPGRLPYWIGNVKKYRLDTTGATPVLRDSAGALVLDSDGQISETARSFWLRDNAPDGRKVAEGGVAHLLGADRNLYTSSAGNALVPLNEANTQAADFGDGVDAALKQRLLQFIQGKKPTDPAQPRKRIGDVLHSRPVLVDYPNYPVLFVGTNEGYLHAFRADTGVELFGFMPRELLKNVRTFYENKLDTSKERPNGMDGPITVWFDDANRNAKLDADERRYLTAGMRRGGSVYVEKNGKAAYDYDHSVRNYYTLDITDPARPALKWVARGGEGDFAHLGQTWSAPVYANVELGGERRQALIFAGGYDPAQDDRAQRGRDRIGDYVYIVEATTGRVLWSQATGGGSSIPANPRVVDIDGNGVADRVYLADVGGRLYRVDLPDSTNRLLPKQERDKLCSDGKCEPRLTLIADLGGDASAADNRRFFYEPDASIVRDGARRFVALAIGSGFRSHPLEKGTVQDRLYMIVDPNLYSIPEGFTAVSHASLTDVTTKAAESATAGWYLDLNRATGEKALARAVTINNRVFFTTFAPGAGTTAEVCGPPRHQGHVYALDIRNAKAVIRFTDLDKQPGDLTEADRSLSVATSDILPEVHFNVRSDPTKNNEVVIDTFIGGRFDRYLGQQRFESLRRVFWEQEK